MLDSAAFPVIFFLLSFYAFAIAILFALAQAWDRTLSVRPPRPGIPKTAISSLTSDDDIKHS